MTSPIADDRKRRDLTQGSLTRTLLGLSFPIMGQMAFNSLYALTDAFWLGKQKTGATESLAAVGPTAALCFIVVAFGTGFGNGGTALVSQHTGAKRHRDADRAAGQMLLLLTCTTTFLAALMYILAPQILALLQTPANVMPQALPFLRILLLGMPFIAFNIAYGSVLRALGDTVTMVLIGLSTNVLNFFLSPVLIFGLGPAPAMGIRGAATVSAFSSIMTAFICVILLRRGRSGLRLTWVDIRPNWGLIRQIFRIGLPTAISFSSNSIGFLVLQGMISSLGATVMAAYTVGSRVTELFSVPASALALSTAPVVGQALGAGKPTLARRAVRTSVMLFAFGMLLPQVFLMFEGHLVARAFTPKPEVVAEIGRFFLIVPASNYFFNVMMVLLSAFIGSGHTRPVMVISLVRQWVFRLPVSLIFGFVLGWRSLGVYTGLAVGNVVSTALAWRMFGRGDWEHAVVPVRGESPPPAKSATEPLPAATDIAEP